MTRDVEPPQRSSEPRGVSIPVSPPSLAPLSELMEILEEAWRTGILTHDGPLVRRLERELADRLGLADLACVTNGTVALQLAIRALDVRGEILTTPFTWIATMSAIQAEGCTAAFADIDPGTWNLDPAAVESRITSRTEAILPVHVFSNPCDVEQLQAIAERHGLALIYDAAHALGVRVGGRSLFAYGDVSATSFHATKIFNTAEGGACVARDPAVLRRIRRLRFFGFDDSRSVSEPGLNGKMTEVHAALGLANLRHFDEVLLGRRAKHERYRERLSRCPFVTLQRHPSDAYNYSYLPLVFDTEARLLAVAESLARAGVATRRYFHPALHRLALAGSAERFPVAERIAATILCLPLSEKLSDHDIDRICALVVA